MGGKRFYIDKSTRMTLCYVVMLVLLIICGKKCYYFITSYSSFSPHVITSEQRKAIEQFNENIRNDSIKRVEKYAVESASSESLFLFDPNTIDSLSLIKLGLKKWQIKNLMKYRRKGGRWKSPQDFSRLYGLSRETYQKLLPYIYIEPDIKEIERVERQNRYDSISRKYVQKLPEGTIIDLNEADTNLLKQVPGIGSYYASKICRYRESLGGFVSQHQIKEIDGLPSDIERWFSVSSHKTIRRINVNKASFKELVHHPYLNYEQVKVIFSYRNKYGDLKSWNDLRFDEHFESSKVERLKPYFCF